MIQHLSDGKIAEMLALKYLKRQHLTLVAQNWQAKQGEIDLIMQDTKTLIFIEVRYRQYTQYGTPFETITYSKRKKIITTARLFLQKNTVWAEKNYRFDVISITGDLNNTPTIQWLTNAFSLS